jgi:hypothetical protein
MPLPTLTWILEVLVTRKLRAERIEPIGEVYLILYKIDKKDTI